MSNQAWVTLATNDSYGLGALVLVHSLRRVGSVYPAVVLITPSVTDAMRERLRADFADVIVVDVLDSRDEAHLALLQRPELGITFTKLHCWSLTQYEKCVFLDADVLIVQNCDELFDREELSAAPDVGWPDCFNSGVFVYRPSQETFNSLIKFAKERGSFDGGDQGLLNSYFADWAHGDINKHLPFLYNVTSAAFYSYLPALKHYGQNLKIIHFIGAAKPWLQSYNWESQSVDAPGHLKETLQIWWDIFVSSVHPQLDESMVEPDARPELPPEDSAQYYVHEVNPHSEFPWHHTDNLSFQEEEQRAPIDLSEFHDPWDLYTGNIPPKENLTHSEHEADNNGRVVITQDLRDYAWDYKAQQLEPEKLYKTHITQSQQQNSHQWHQQVHVYQSHHQTSAHHQPTHGNNHCQHHCQQHDHHSLKLQNESYTPHKEHSWTNDNKVNSFSKHEPHSLNSHHHTAEHMHIKTEIKPPKQKHRIANVNTSNPIDIYCNGIVVTNCDHSGDDSEEYEDFRPRHPYDGFYLRHRAAIDSKGKRVCLHQVPPTPPPSPPPESPEPSIEDDADLYQDAIDVQTGVAGNLARVTPGTTASQAIDELTRRQGWEAGNIDYMGADSFDNIWAKISQTLNQAPKQPPPPKEPSPPRKEPTPPPKEPTPPPKEPKSSPKEPTPPPKEPSPPPKEPSPPPKEPTPPPKEPTPPPKEPIPPPKEPTPPLKEPTPPPKEPTPPPKQPSPPPKDASPPPKEPSLSKEEPPLLKQPSPPKELSTAPIPAPAAAPTEAPKPAEPKIVPPTPPVTPKSTPESSTTPEELVPSNVETVAVAPIVIDSTEPKAAPAPATPVVAAGASSPSQAKTQDTPVKNIELSGASTDSPPLANTPAKEEVSPPVSKTEGERTRRPMDKLQLHPPAAADPLPTPDSELEDAATLAQSIIASELATPTVTSATPPALLTPASLPPSLKPQKSLSVDEPALDTPPAGPVSLAQIGVKPSKAKPTIAAQIESSITDKPETPTPPTTPTDTAPKKKVVKKVVKKVATAAAGGDTPVPPPRKKEKKPKE